MILRREVGQGEKGGRTIKWRMGQGEGGDQLAYCPGVSREARFERGIPLHRLPHKELMGTKPELCIIR